MKASILPRFPGSIVPIHEGEDRLGQSCLRAEAEKAGDFQRAWSIRGLIAVAIMIPVLHMVSAAARTSEDYAVPEEGLWLAQDHDGVFRIGHCGDMLCGRLIGMKYEGAVPKDMWGRSQCGLVMLTDFRRVKDENLWRGYILDPETGRTYDARIHAESSEVLKLRGFILGIPFLGKTQTWTRFRGTIGPNCKLP